MSMPPLIYFWPSPVDQSSPEVMGELNQKAKEIYSPGFTWRRHPDLNRGVEDLQSSALPLGYVAA